MTATASTTIAAPKVFTVAELAQRVGGELRGNGQATITSVNSIADAKPTDITFISSAQYARQWPASKAGSAVVTRELQSMFQSSGDSRPLVFVADAEIAMIHLLELFEVPETAPDVGVHPTAVVHPTVKLGRQARIGPHVSIDQGAVIGDGVVLHGGVRIYANVQIGAGSVLHGNTVVRERCVIGRGVILHQNVSIGADGFGYRPDPTGAGLLKVPHIGNVILEDGVEIGSNSCVDRGKFGSTIVGAGTKIDNICQIAHNCRIGRCCVIAGCAGISGSVTIGDGVQMGGMVGIIDHITIGSGARLGAMCFVMRDIPPGQSVLGYPADDGQTVLRQWASVRKLPGLLRPLSRHIEALKR